MKVDSGLLASTATTVVFLPATIKGFAGSDLNDGAVRHGSCRGRETPSPRITGSRKSRES